MISPANYNLHVMFTTLFVATIPILTGYDFNYLNTVANNDAIMSSNVAFTSFALIFATLPAMLDSILDMLCNKRIKTKSSEYWHTRTCITFASFVTGILFFLASNNPSRLFISNLPAAMAITRCYFDVVAFCSLMNGLCVCKPDLFTVRQTFFVSLFYAFSNTCRLYGVGTEGFFDTFSSVLVLLSTANLGLNSLYWTYNMRTWKFKSIQEKSSALYLGMIYFLLLAVLTSILFSWLTTSSTGSFSSTLLFLNATIVGNILLAVIPGRINRFETMEAKIEVTVTRTDCTKYIVEKMRGPWQAVSIGLVLLYEQIPLLYLNGLPTMAAEASDTAGSENNSPVNVIEAAINIICGASNSVANAMRNFNFYSAHLSGELILLKQSDLNLRILLQEVIQKFDVDLNQKGISVTQMFATLEGRWLSLYTGDIIIDADGDLIDLLMFNLLSNAIKFTPSGGHIKLVAYVNKNNEYISNDETSINRIKSDSGNSRISFLPPFASQNLSMPYRNDVVVIQIIDTGVGISENDKLNLFKEVQLKSVQSSNANGTSQIEGLGLWVSKRIVELHGGKIVVYSQGLGLGSTFNAELPIGMAKVNSNVRLQVEFDEGSREQKNSNNGCEQDSNVDSNQGLEFGLEVQINQKYDQNINKRLEEPENKYDELFKSPTEKISLRYASESNSKSVSQHGSNIWKPTRTRLWAAGRTNSTNTSTWQPHGISVAIEGPQSSFKRLVTNALGQRFQAVVMNIPDTELDCTTNFRINGHQHPTSQLLMIIQILLQRGFIYQKLWQMHVPQGLMYLLKTITGDS